VEENSRESVLQKQIPQRPRKMVNAALHGKKVLPITYNRSKNVHKYDRARPARPSNKQTAANGPE